MPNASVSVIIPAFNAEKTIGRTLEAIQKQSYPNIEIMIVDDGSTDRTQEIVQSFSGVKYVFQENAGPATARNHGARLASSDILFFTDSDCTPQPDWIEKILTGFEQKDVGVVCGSYGIANPQSLLARCIHQEIRYRHHELVPDFPKVFGSYNFAVRKHIFESVGGFNTQYRWASGEDNDLSYKIIHAGHKIFFQRDALVDHVHPSSVLKYLKEQYRHGFWRAKMYLDFPNMIKGDDYTFWKDSGEVAMVFPILGLLLAGLFLNDILTLAIILIGLLFSMELIFSWMMTKKFYAGFFYSLVMFFRAFARAFGLSSGILHFCLKKNKNKSNSS